MPLLARCAFLACSRTSIEGTDEVPGGESNKLVSQGSASALSTSQINNFRLSIKMQMLRSLINYAAALQPHRMATLLLFAEGSLLRVAVSAIHEPLFWWFPLLVHEPRRNVVVFSMISSPILCPLLVHEPRRNVVVCTSIMKNLGKASDAKRPHCLNFFLSLRELLELLV